MYLTSGTCDDGQCSYQATMVDCPHGCEGSACRTDPCMGVACNTPPPNDCVSVDTLLVYDTKGTCDAGACSYGSHEQACEFGCENDACKGDPCGGVTCNTPPANYCADADNLTVHEATGTCDGGACSYASHTEPCVFGCDAGACKGDPCAGVTCNTPNADYCADPDTLRSFATPGTCNAGACEYDATDTTCTFGCENGTCRACLDDPHCDPGHWCNAGTCEACDTAAHCGDACTDCTASGQTCSAGACVDCALDTDCAATGMWCDAGSCRTCDTAAHCGATCAPCGGTTPACEGGACVCDATSCPANQHCQSGVCEVCASDDACGVDCTSCGGQHCLVEGGTSSCVACTDDSHCDTAAGEVCHPTQHVCTLDTCVGTLYASDFESDDGALLPDGAYWQWGAATAGPGACAGGAKCWGTELGGDYGACEHDVLTSPTLDLSQCGGKVITLTLRVWYEYEITGGALYDGLLVEYFDGAQWVQPDPEGGWDTDKIYIYNCTGVYLENKPGFGGDSGGWVTKTFVLPMLTGIPDFKFRIVHGTDVSTHYAGAYVDDVELSAP